VFTTATFVGYLLPPMWLLPAVSLGRLRAGV